MKFPAIGFPSPTAPPNAEILNRVMGVVALTSVCSSNASGCLKTRKMYLHTEDRQIWITQKRSIFTGEHPIRLEV